MLHQLFRATAMNTVAKRSFSISSTRLALYKPDLFPKMLNEDKALVPVAERTRVKDVKALLDFYKEHLSDVSLKSTY